MHHVGPLGSGRTENAIYHFALNIVSAFTGTLLKSPEATEVGTSESAKHCRQNFCISHKMWKKEEGGRRLFQYVVV